MFRFLLVLVVVFPPPAWSGEVETAETDYRAGVYKLDFQVTIDGRVDKVYAIVTDYDRLKDISNLFVETALISPPGAETKRRRLVSKSCVLFFCYEAVLVEDVQEIDGKIILTTVIPEESDFKYGKSRWEVTAVDAGHSRIHFSYEIQPDFWVPPVIGPFFIKRKLLAEAKRTIARIEILAGDG
jgi:hypothetical protein